MPLDERCGCDKKTHKAKLVVLTGGPGAGKTAILALAKRYFCEHVAVLPEAASILYSGGFWRLSSITGRMAVQRAIVHVQHEQERMAVEEGKYAVVLCDRGVLDGPAYWPKSEKSFYEDLQTTREEELSHYEKVIYLRTPTEDHGYNLSNPTRIESTQEAMALDKSTLQAWRGHPNLVVIESTQDFFDKVLRTMREIQDELPSCCKRHFEKTHLQALAS